LERFESEVKKSWIHIQSKVIAANIILLSQSFHDQDDRGTCCDVLEWCNEFWEWFVAYITSKLQLTIHPI